MTTKMFAADAKRAQGTWSDVPRPVMSAVVVNFGLEIPKRRTRHGQRARTGECLVDGVAVGLIREVHVDRGR